MAPIPEETPETAKDTAPRPVRSGLLELIRFLVTLVLLAGALRSLLVSPFNIPSESMLPRLLVGDYLFVEKWSYGYSRYSFPFGPHLFDGRILAREPQRGDVVVFKAPPQNKEDWIKRLIGLPGDLIQMKDGQLSINGVAVPKVRVADFVEPMSPNTRCQTVPQSSFGPTTIDGKRVCRFPRYRETLPNGRSYYVIDQGQTRQDNTEVFVVPEGHYFMMGDNRDDSADSRFPQVVGEGIGFVPAENLEGRAAVTFFSTDGSAQWLEPWTWFTAARGTRIGETF